MFKVLCRDFTRLFFFFPLGEYFGKGHRYRKGGGEGGGGQILPAATLNVNNFFFNV